MSSPQRAALSWFQASHFDFTRRQYLNPSTWAQIDPLLMPLLPPFQPVADSEFPSRLHRTLTDTLAPPTSWLLGLLLGPDPVQVPLYLQGKSMKPKDIVSQIAISLEQSSIITIGRRLLVTFRVPACHLSREEVARVMASMDAQAPHHSSGAGKGMIDDAKKRRQQMFASKVEPIQSPFASDDSGLRRIFEGVRRKMDKKTQDVEVRCEVSSLYGVHLDTISGWSPRQCTCWAPSRKPPVFEDSSVLVPTSAETHTKKNVSSRSTSSGGARKASRWFFSIPSCRETTPSEILSWFVLRPPPGRFFTLLRRSISIV